MDISSGSPCNSGTLKLKINGKINSKKNDQTRKVTEQKIMVWLIHFSVFGFKFFFLKQFHTSQQSHTPYKSLKHTHRQEGKKKQHKMGKLIIKKGKVGGDYYYYYSQVWGTEKEWNCPRSAYVIYEWLPKRQYM